MEIRNALQKIENYLTVVSNLNKTILSEGTMSRDELLLMKKYLYTSIDRIEDIERLLVIDRKDEKSFTPTATTANTYVPPKSKEIMEIEATTSIDEVEASLTNAVESEPVMEETAEEIKAIFEEEDMEIVGEIMPQIVMEEVQEESIQIPEIKMEEEVEEHNVSSGIEIAPVIENIITEDFAFDELEVPVQTDVVETILAETPLAEEKEIPFVNMVVKEEETIAARFSENKAATFAEELVSQKKEQVMLFEHLTQKLNATPQSQLFEMFEEDKEELQDTFMNTAPSFEQPDTSFVSSDHSYAGESVLVAEKIAEPLIEQMTPSSLNDVFRPQAAVETISPKVNKTFSESIALNDKFIFVRELFGNQFGEYEQGLKHLDAQSSFTAAEGYCRGNLWQKFNWNDKGPAVERFMELLQKRFD